MKISKMFLILALFPLLFSSCKKDHYDISQVNGVAAEGEVLLPLASASYTMLDMMQRFQIDSLITFSEDGGMSFGYFYDHPGAVRGNELLRFKDWEYEEHFAFDNPSPNGVRKLVDTVLNMSQDVVFEADHIHVMSALMKSGRFEFDLSSNIDNLGQVVITTSNITDAQGHDFRFVYEPQTGQTGFDMEGLLYHTDTPNTLTLNYEIHAEVQGLTAPEMEFDVHIHATDLAIREMSGYVDEYSSRNVLDTVFSLFPDNLAGSLEITGAQLRLSERNTFDLDAQLVVDTALVYGEGIEPYSLFEPLPISIDLPSQNAFSEVYSQSVSGKIDAAGGRAWASSLLTVNTEGLNTLVTVADTCNIDVHVDVDIPFAFSIDEVRYLDTVNMKLSEIEMPEMIEELTLELTFNSTFPLNLGGGFYMYDSESEQITDTLLVDARLIEASFDGHPTSTTLSFEITEDRVENVMRSDRIIMLFILDTDARDVVINANQKLDMFAKAKVKYNGTVELGKE